MARILVINPNSSAACSAGIDAVVDRFRLPGAPAIEVATLCEGPPAIMTWQHWHAVVGPICAEIEREAADAYIIACASDPGIEAARSVTRRPVLGIFRSAVASAVARAERFGIIAMVDASVPRHAAALRSMGLEARLAGEVPLNLPMQTLLDPKAARSALIRAAEMLRSMGAETLILGCTGMAHHRAAVQEAAGLPVIEPTQAAVTQAIGILLAEAG
ncbi:aspartate/glutamate racemase family protein [Rhodopila sp.]|jgi:Asp/Glu/hydantoin racemase|uniref:aspartate/glutamate racemase family protein n=1 Tax=Rhodopila sp. TaxID=2480087 RepID=UPI002C2A2BD6|nr:aspartate/glutamate racemase family protein [Rhodopila sp.]HVZ08461.1 aspartate/glutamate racemase family protein [Rhodopila sp.]